MYDARKMGIVAYVNNCTIWHYQSGDALAELLQPDYFLPAAEALRCGDYLLASSQTASSPQFALLALADLDAQGARWHGLNFANILPQREALLSTQ